MLLLHSTVIIALQNQEVNGQAQNRRFAQISSIYPNQPTIFNKITYIKYHPFSFNDPEIDFLIDYAKILGSVLEDPKMLTWQYNNRDRLGLNQSTLEKIKEKYDNK
ncbi:MAG: hypothetical protein HUJ70_02095, partial [Pseudobutyrivibrio sp.]|nr:hypothetical protein [Pseudobutyrivibrio sp.]